ncbi:Phospholipase/carboxylesterase/thioesterase [Moelleriella libera RCEF 2490]|uniref:Phospholipase/carboxylesterase/thioesterase n=1 Tax=Moelleriella libera RCEF 2490 TaxID=1081109 RepID=A0A168D8P2_9HYPO|nr:Phospholipase/carboxylesterase/thioesterase [Moelleriella libera RCEF 2490]
MPPRIPTHADFASLSSTTLPLALHFPVPPESTTTFLILFHGLGDSELPFAMFARNLHLPNTLAISVRGTSSIPPSMLHDLHQAPLPSQPQQQQQQYYHWGDDLLLDQATGDLDPDPGFSRACALVTEKLVRGILVERCGWDTSDVLLFGFGQGAALALGLPLTEGLTYKGVVAIGPDAGGVPASMRAKKCGTTTMTMTLRGKQQAQQGQGRLEDAKDEEERTNDTPVLLVQGQSRQDENAVRESYGNVQVVRWKRSEVDMPRSKEEMIPIMKFFAERLKSGFL